MNRYHIISLLGIFCIGVSVLFPSYSIIFNSIATGCFGYFLSQAPLLEWIELKKAECLKKMNEEK